jgi:hypothetical protein
VDQSILEVRLDQSIHQAQSIPEDLLRQLDQLRLWGQLIL